MSSLRTRANDERSQDEVGNGASAVVTSVGQSDTYQRLGSEIGKLVDEKHAAYGNSFGSASAFLRLLFPQGVLPDRYEDLLYIVRIYDKIVRLVTNRDAFGESPLQDICGYSLLALELENRRRNG